MVERHPAIIARRPPCCPRSYRFDSTTPARAIRCACAIRAEARELGVELRAGLHTGECELIGDDLGGLAVHVAARVGSEAGPGDVLVSGTVRDLLLGSGIELVDRGVHELKGVPGEWRLFAVAGEVRRRRSPYPSGRLPPLIDPA